MGVLKRAVDARTLRDRARRFRVLATGLSSDVDRQVLERMADELEAEARQLDHVVVASNDDTPGF